MQAYHRSKLANLLFTYELARELEGSGVTANAAKPGFTQTNLGCGNGWSPFSTLAAQSAAEGARASVHLAASPKVEGVNGRYFYRKSAIGSSPQTHDRRAARQLWELSERLVETK